MESGRGPGEVNGKVKVNRKVGVIGPANTVMKSGGNDV